MKLAPFELERYFSAHEFSARRLLCCSDCETWSIRGLLDLEPGAGEAFLDLRLGYTESAGHPSLRAAVAGLYEGLEAEDVLIVSGAEEGIFLFMLAEIRAGDHLVVQYPAYQSLFQVARGMGAEVDLWTLREENGWRPDLGDLAKLLRPRTRAVVVNSPHNPTGGTMSAEDYQELDGLTRKHGFIIFSDEVYRGLEYDPAARPPALAEINPTGLSLGVMSKSFGLAGLRIGWLAGRDRELLRRINALKDYTTICASAPAEFLATLALRHEGTIVGRNLGIIQDNLVKLRSFMGRHQETFAWAEPSAGPIAFPRLKSADAGAFCRQLLKNTGLLLLPGRVYGPEYAAHFRVGFGRADFGGGLDLLEGYLSQSRP